MTKGPLTAYSILFTQGFMFSTSNWESGLGAMVNSFSLDAYALNDLFRMTDPRYEGRLTGGSCPANRSVQRTCCLAVSTVLL